MQCHTPQDLNPCNIPWSTEPKSTSLHPQVPHSGHYFLSKLNPVCTGTFGTATWLWARWPRAKCMADTHLSLLHNGCSSYGAYPSSYCMTIKASFPRGKMAATWSWQLSSIQHHIYTPTPPSRLHSMHRDNFTFLQLPQLYTKYLQNSLKCYLPINDDAGRVAMLLWVSSQKFWTYFSHPYSRCTQQ